MNKACGEQQQQQQPYIMAAHAAGAIVESGRGCRRGGALALSFHVVHKQTQNTNTVHWDRWRAEDS